MPRSEFLPPSPPEPASALSPGPGAVARLVRSLRGLPSAERWWGPGCAGLPGWFQAESTPPSDATPRFRELYAQVRRGTPVLPAEANRHLYLLVKGMLGDELFGYLEDNQLRLERRGLDTEAVSVDTEGSLEANVAKIRKALEDAAFFRRSVVLVGHSKGAVESLSALAMYPHLRTGVRAVVALQAPYGGSPVAHDLMASPEMRRVVDIALPLLFYGVSRSVEDLSYPRRMDFVRRHPYPVEIPTVSLASSRDSRRSLLWPVANYLRQRYGLASDGLVAAVDAEIPGSRVVRLDDLDHAQAALLGIPGLAPYHPGDLTEAMVALALE
ncbi:lipase [Stigmatella sp. ncwal1]|uniref:Lipase n=1 Tax=Stigmatella ashevillensis TaxID=2995309 RepID=A0ABT5DLE4_9BACT|nr:lipase [Stigmatella ashevillena]MDC0713568.1 lipase [Stigmatella ashevillena]